MSKVVRVDEEVYGMLVGIKGRLEIDCGRPVSMNEAVGVAIELAALPFALSVPA